MLTQEDLEQIGKVIDGRLKPIKQDMQGLKQDVQELKDGQVRLEQKIDRVDQRVSQNVEILGDFIVEITNLWMAIQRGLSD